MADHDASTGDHAFDDSLESVLPEDEPAASSAAAGEELETVCFLTRRLAWLRKTPPGACERTWESVQERISSSPRTVAAPGRPFCPGRAARLGIRPVR